MTRKTGQIHHRLRCRGLGICLLALGSIVSAEPVWAFKIVAPADGATLKSGQTVTARVDLGADTGIVKVRYYWYRDQADTLVQQDDSDASPLAQPDTLADDTYSQQNSITGAPVVAVAALSSGFDQNPPFGGLLNVPKDAVGPMRLLAVAEISRGRLGTHTVFDEVIIEVEPEAALQTIDFETEKPLQLGRSGQSSAFGHVDSMGKIFELPVVGEFADGVVRPLASPASGTTYQSSNPAAIKVLSGGMLQIVGNGKTTLTVANRGKQASLDVNVTVNDEPNEPPVADAGRNRTVKAGTKVKLSGLNSRDAEGEALYYSWSQVRGSKVPLLDVNGPEASFQAPHVSEPRTYRFKLRVTDKKGADSLPAFVDVTVEP
ncbi:MAG: PKD domain-containing protein [Nitrospira sp.]|nr:PKD domain-containing protein [Nitrospira sp.]